MLWGFNHRFQWLSLCKGQVAYALLTRPPLSIAKIYRSFIWRFLARLACVRHAASVHPEPGSNSLLKSYIKGFRLYYLFPQKSFPFLGSYAIAFDYCLLKKLSETFAYCLPICWLFRLVLRIFSLRLNFHTMKFSRFSRVFSPAVRPAAEHLTS